MDKKSSSYSSSYVNITQSKLGVNYGIQFHRIYINGLGLNRNNVNAVLELLKEGATIPFIARYRKEKTGNLDEIKVNDIKTSFDNITELLKRKETILKSIEEQEKLTPELKTKINNCMDPKILEDIYLPYKKGKKTKADVAIELGLEPLSDIIYLQKKVFGEKSEIVQNFLKNNKIEIKIEDALKGAEDIIAQKISETAFLRQWIRNFISSEGKIQTKVKKEWKEKPSKFEMYYDFEEQLKRCPGHRILAIRRGTNEKIISWKINVNQEHIIGFIKDKTLRDDNHIFASELENAINDSLKRLIYPSLEKECFNEKIEEGETESIKVFAGNLKNLLLFSPLGEKTILGVDPGFRTGCKLAVIDKTGKFLNYANIFPNQPQNRLADSEAKVLELVKKYKIEYAAIGNGTASRETESFFKGIIKKNNLDLKTVMVSEAGASIYSASVVAREEFPDLDLTVRSAVSIGRRFQDPLAELIKIDPKSIGVGQYQHDVNQKELKKSLDFTVEYCVNHVGVDLNTASYSLLSHVSGIGPVLAKNIVNYRDENGTFIERKILKKVAKLGPKAYEQCAGFLKIRNGKNPLDNTAIHPESYKTVKFIAEKLNMKIEELIENGNRLDSIKLHDFVTESAGIHTLEDIVKELKKPGRDPRSSFKYAGFDDSVNSMEDLKIDMVLEGIITNVTNFGAFVDIGVHQDGLIHISKLSNSFVKDPNEIVSVNENVKVKVIGVDVPRKRISLERLGK